MVMKGAGGKAYKDDESWKTGSSAKQERMSAYLEWLLVPEPLRDPSSKKEFAELLGVHDSTLWRYEQDRRFQKEFMKRRRGLFKVSDADTIIRAQIEIASDPDHKSSTQAARFLFDWMEKHEDKQDQPLDLSELSDEEISELVNEYLSNET